MKMLYHKFIAVKRNNAYSRLPSQCHVRVFILQSLKYDLILKNTSQAVCLPFPTEGVVDSVTSC